MRKISHTVDMNDAFQFEETWSPLQEGRDQAGEQTVLELAEMLRTSERQFVDPHFPPNEYALYLNAKPGSDAATSFRTDQDPFLAGVEGLEWKRPSEIGDPELTAVCWSKGIHSDDISQGKLGNCYFLAALSSCAGMEDDSLIRDLVVEEGADVGLYGVKFFLNGKWVTTVVDTLIPCTFNGRWWNPIFSHLPEHEDNDASEKEFWPLIFEKAWAKLHGSYEATAGGQTADTVNYLTGGVCTKVSRLKRPTQIKVAHVSPLCCRPTGGGVTDMGWPLLVCQIEIDDEPSDEWREICDLLDDNDSGGERASERFPSAPTSLRNCLLTPELQWQSRGKRRISQGGGCPRETLGWCVGADDNAFLDASVMNGHDSGELKAKGLMDGHAYSLLKALTTTEGQQLICLRNPWGSFEWEGRFSDSSSDWTPSLKEQCQFSEEDDGTFWMLFSDFCKYVHASEHNPTIILVCFVW